MNIEELQKEIEELKDMVKGYEDVVDEKLVEINELKDKLTDVFNYADSIMGLQ